MTLIWFVYSVYFLTLYYILFACTFLCVFMCTCMHIFMPFGMCSFFFLCGLGDWTLVTSLSNKYPCPLSHLVDWWKFESEIRMYCQPTALFLIKLSFKIKGKIVSIIETIHPKQTCCVTYFYSWCIIHISISRKENNIDLLVHLC